MSDRYSDEAIEDLLSRADHLSLLDKRGRSVLVIELCELIHKLRKERRQRSADRMRVAELVQNESAAACRRQSAALERNGEPIQTAWAASGCALAVERLYLPQLLARLDDGE